MKQSRSEDWLRARLRPRDYDIKEVLDKLDLAPGELSEMIRNGMRLVLFGGNNAVSRPTTSPVAKRRRG